MYFIKTDQQNAQLELAKLLISHLSSNQQVLWLISGGSNLAITTAVMKLLEDKLTATLTIMPIDERFGPVGHPNSNVQQLYEAGFKLKQATFISVLRGKPLLITSQEYGQELAKQFSRNNFIVAQCGLGIDGHTAGILPGSPAATNQPDWVIGYRAADFDRLSLTFWALRQINQAVVFAYGPKKRSILEELRDQKKSLVDQPAQIFKVIPESYIYNDFIEGEIIR